MWGGLQALPPPGGPGGLPPGWPGFPGPGYVPANMGGAAGMMGVGGMGVPKVGAPQYGPPGVPLYPPGGFPALGLPPVGKQMGGKPPAAVKPEAPKKAAMKAGKAHKPGMGGPGMKKAAMKAAMKVAAPKPPRGRPPAGVALLPPGGIGGGGGFPPLPPPPLGGYGPGPGGNLMAALGGLVPPIPMAPPAAPPVPGFGGLPGGPGGLPGGLGVPVAGYGYGAPQIQMMPGFPGYGQQQYGQPQQSPSMAPSTESTGWISGVFTPGTLAPKLKDGSLLECPCYDPLGQVAGTTIFRVLRFFPPDALGQYFEALHLGCSDPRVGAAMDEAFPQRSVADASSPNVRSAIVHLCAQERTSCPASHPQREVMHVDTARLRNGNEIVEPFFIRSRYLVSGGSPPRIPVDSPMGPAGFTSLKDLSEVDLLKKVKELKSRWAQARLEASDGSVASNLAAVAAVREAERPSKRQRYGGSGDPLMVEDDESSSQLFRDAPSLGMTGRIQMIAKRDEGRLYQQAMAEMSRYLGSRGGASINAPAKWVTYLTTIFHGQHSPDKIGPRNCTELRTLAEALDSLGEGSLPHLGDLLTQRFKSIENAISLGHWGLSKELELIPPGSVGLTSQEERQQAARGSLLDLKVSEASGKLKG